MICNFAILSSIATAVTALKLFEGQKILENSRPAHLEIPSLGLGLWNSKDDLATDSVKHAFDAGYNHFDSAAAYNNEQYVGRGLHSKKHAPQDRSQYWITSKLWNDAHKPSLVGAALNKTLDDLGVDYLDLYLMHWPVAFKPDAPKGRTIIDEGTSIADTWKAMEDLVRTYNATGRGTRHIGVSNYSPRQLDEIIQICTICPYAHEFETHPYLQQQPFVDFHQEKNIKVIAYSPLANSNPNYDGKHPDLDPILQDPFWQDVAKTKNVTVAQAVLGWGIARGTVVIPKSTHKDRIEENIAAINVTYTREELALIRTKDKHKRFNDPSKSWGVELFEGLDDGSNRFVMDHY